MTARLFRILGHHAGTALGIVIGAGVALAVLHAIFAAIAAGCGAC